MKATVYAQGQLANADDLVKEYLPLVKKIGMHLVARLPPDVEFDDLLQVGLIGLVQAGSSYDQSRGASFATYAGIRIKGAMLDEVRRNDWVPRSVQQKMKRVSDAITRMEARLGRPVLDTEIADELEISVDEYRDITRELSYCRLSSLDDSALEVASDEADPFANIKDEDFKQQLLEAIKSLPEKEALMMSLYYGDELNLKEIGAVLGVSESRVSQIHGQALARVRAKLGEWTA